MNKQSKVIVAGGATLLTVIVAFYPRSQEPIPHAFDMIELIPEPSDAPRDSEWLARAKYDFLTRDQAPTIEDVEGYAIFIQKYSENRISLMADETQ